MQNWLIIKDIVCLSGVGKLMVFCVFNNESGVSEWICECVEVVMQQYGFLFFCFVCVMCGQSDKVVVIIVICFDLLLENFVVQIMLFVFYEQGYDLIMMESQFFLVLVEEYFGMFVWCNIDGVVLFGFIGIDEVMFVFWCDILVLMVCDVFGFVLVCYDDEGVIMLLMQWFYDCGYCYISFFGVLYSDVIIGECCYLVYFVFCKKYCLMFIVVLLGLGMKQGYDIVVSVLMVEISVLVCVMDIFVFGVSKYFQQQGCDVLQFVSVGSMLLMKFFYLEILIVDLGYVEFGCWVVWQLIEQIVGSVDFCQIVIFVVFN